VNRLQAGRPGFDSLQEQGFVSVRYRVETGSGAYPASYPMGTTDSFPDVKAVGA